MATIILLEHLLQRGADMPYMVYALAEIWRARGHRVATHHGAENPPPGDIAVLNVDLTVIPAEYRALLARYPRVINGAVLDVSKRGFSQTLLQRGSDWSGQVIVKTDANFGGRPEQLWRSVAAQAGLRCDIPAGPVLESYPMFGSLGEVPDVIWRTSGLVVDRFVPERDPRGYYLRVWSFFGDCERSVRWRALHPIVKASNMVEREFVEVPDDIRRWREALGFDFGKFDYVLHDGRFVLLDVNRTPSFPLRAGGGKPTLGDLAGGLEFYLRERRAPSGEAA